MFKTSFFRNRILQECNPNHDLNMLRPNAPYDDYDLFIDFTKSLKDQVSKALFPAANYDTTHSNIVNGELVEYGTDEYVRDDDGRMLTCGGYSQYAPYNRDTSQWSGSGPWTITTESLDTGTYTIETFVDGATVSISAGTATIDGAASATYGNADTFEVTVSGTVVITSDTADPLSHLTKSEYHLPFVPNDTAGSIAVSATYADDNAGDELGPRLAFADIPGAVDALDGVADGGDTFDGFYSVGANLSANNGSITVIASGQSNDNRLYIGTEVADAYTEIQFTLNQQCTVIVYNYAISAYVYYNNLPSGTHSLRSVFNGLGQCAIIVDDAGTVISDFTLKEISPASGEIEQKIRFGFDYDQAGTGDHALLSCNLTNDPVIWVDNTGTVSASDGTNTVTADIDYQADTDYTIILKYDGYNSLMKLNVNGTDYTAGTFNGSFDPDLDDHLYLGYQNDELIKCESLKFRKEVTW